MVRNVRLRADSWYYRLLVRERFQKFERFAMDCARVVLYWGHYMWNPLCSVARRLARMAWSSKKVLLRAGQFPTWRRWMKSSATLWLGQEGLDDVRTRHLCHRICAKLPGPDFALILPHKLRNSVVVVCRWRLTRVSHCAWYWRSSRCLQIGFKQGWIGDLNVRLKFDGLFWLQVVSRGDSGRWHRTWLNRSNFIRVLCCCFIVFIQIRLQRR